MPDSYQPTIIPSSSGQRRGRWLKHFGNIVFVIMLFPWISFGLNQYDTQPWAIPVGLLFILLTLDKKVSGKIFFVYFLPLATVVVLLACFRGLETNSLRALGGALMIVVCVHFFYVYRRYLSGSLVSILSTVNVIWLGAGVVQVIFGKHVLEFLVNVRTTPDRGVTSLAPEPTHFAMYLIFLSWLMLIESDHKPSYLVCILLALNVLSILFVASSSMGAIFVLLCLFLWSIQYLRNPVRLFFGGVLFCALISSFYIYSVSFPDARISSLFSQGVGDPISLVEKDASINSRMSHVILPLYGFAKNGFMPHGFNAYDADSERLNRDFGGFFWYEYGGDKIMSGLGSLLYELGFLSVPFFCFLASMFFGAGSLLRSFISSLLLTVLLMSAIPLSFSLASMVPVLYYLRARHLLVDNRRFF